MTIHSLTASERSLERSRSSLLWIIPGLIVGLVWIWRTSWVFEGQRLFTLFDDALISLGYARTLADTGELVWYPGAPRVEGITNPLWTLYMSLFHFLKVPEQVLIPLVSVTGLFAVLASALLAGRLGRLLIPDQPWVEKSSIVAVSLSFPALFWSIRGMEVGLQLLFTLALLVLVLTGLNEETFRKSQFLLAALVVTLGVWTRVDFLITVGAAVTWILIVQRRLPVATRMVATLIITSGAALALQIIWRYGYYGSLLPNTYFLKVEGHSLFSRLLRGQWTDGKLALVSAVLVLAALVFFNHRKGTYKTSRDVGLLVWTGALMIAYSTYVGGDAWDEMTVANRYVVPVYAIAAILLASSTAVICQTGMRFRYFLIPAILAALLAMIGFRAWIRGSIELDRYLNQAPFFAAISGATVILIIGLYWIVVWQAGTPFRRQAAIRAIPVVTTLASIVISGSLSWVSVVGTGGPKVPADRAYTEFGITLGRSLPAGTTIAVTFAGAPVYFSRLPAVDLLGKNDPVIARMPPSLGFKPGHDKYDYQHSLGTLQPDVIAQLFVVDDEDMDYIRSLGYRNCQVSSGNPVDEGIRLWILNESAAAKSAYDCRS